MHILWYLFPSMAQPELEFHQDRSSRNTFEKGERIKGSLRLGLLSRGASWVVNPS